MACNEGLGTGRIHLTISDSTFLDINAHLFPLTTNHPTFIHLFLPIDFLIYECSNSFDSNFSFLLIFYLCKIIFNAQTHYFFFINT